mmetsp:Transcript_12680/g.30161  ORF Transcript_12680/g.30161 Transcript_12680/m.30161 type:complete len:242 (-) Transcript_12680:1303-2028(-)
MTAPGSWLNVVLPFLPPSSCSFDSIPTATINSAIFNNKVASRKDAAVLSESNFGSLEMNASSSDEHTIATSINFAVQEETLPCEVASGEGIIASLLWAPDTNIVEVDGLVCVARQVAGACNLKVSQIDYGCAVAGRTTGLDFNIAFKLYRIHTTKRTNKEKGLVNRKGRPGLCRFVRSLFQNDGIARACAINSGLDGADSKVLNHMPRDCRSNALEFMNLPVSFLASSPAIPRVFTLAASQ